MLRLLIFIAFWAGMFVIAGFAFANGNYRRLLYGTDDYGMYVCMYVRVHLGMYVC